VGRQLYTLSWHASVLLERRRQLHERTAAALETLSAGSVEEHLAELAHHYVRSANLDKAVEYLTRAGQQALKSFRLYRSAIAIAARCRVDQETGSVS
jgi:hypothetical protein